MKSRIKFTETTRWLVMAVMVLCFGLLPPAKAVTPPPDGGYPGNNTAEGTSALFSLTSGVANTAVGYQALYHNTTGRYNTAEGFQALFSNTRGLQNTATGYSALLSNTTGNFNTANGLYALAGNTSGNNNTAIGLRAFGGNGDENTAVGVSTLLYNHTGSRNTAIGYKALFNLWAGNNNIALGYQAGSAVGGQNQQRDNNIEIGNPGDFFDNNTIRIGGLQTSTFIAGIRGASVSPPGLPVIIDSNGQLGTASSSRRFKKEIEPMEKASEAILSLNPVTFHYKEDTTDTPQFGLIAEDVAAVNPDLVVRDKNGEIYTVRYDAVNVMLLNEFLKEHRKVEQQTREMHEQQATIAKLRSDAVKRQATISDLKKEMESVVARLKEHDSKIEKVSGQVEFSEPFARTALNNP
jgi:Chaperone of endosialidase